MWPVARMLFVLVSMPLCLQAQYHIEKNISLNSEHLGEVRKIQISVPKEFDFNGKEKMDVLYILDGEWATSLTKTAYEFLAYAEFIPTNILLVSIPNSYKQGANMRRRDFVPVVSEQQLVSQGVTNFQLFIKEELIPLINSTYPTHPQNNIVYGSSLGGLFAIYTFLQEPSLFKSYLVIEPVLQYQDHYINTLAREQLEKKEKRDQIVWISSREGKPFKAMGSADLSLTLQSKTPLGLRWKVATYSNETHFSVIWKGLYDGLKFIYKK